uniref:RAB36, member RAS oncogene family n=1 Tax=Sus scrofa TaxID=9823 RepID=A0A8D1BP15_PIG
MAHRSRIATTGSAGHAEGGTNCSWPAGSPLPREPENFGAAAQENRLESCPHQAGPGRLLQRSGRWTVVSGAGGPVGAPAGTPGPAPMPVSPAPWRYVHAVSLLQLPAYDPSSDAAPPGLLPLHVLHSQFSGTISDSHSGDRGPVSQGCKVPRTNTSPPALPSEASEGDRHPRVSHKRLSLSTSGTGVEECALVTTLESHMLYFSQAQALQGSCGWRSLRGQDQPHPQVRGHPTPAREAQISCHFGVCVAAVRNWAMGWPGGACTSQEPGTGHTVQGPLAHPPALPALPAHGLPPHRLPCPWVLCLSLPCSRLPQPLSPHSSRWWLTPTPTVHLWSYHCLFLPTVGFRHLQTFTVRGAVSAHGLCQHPWPPTGSARMFSTVTTRPPLGWTLRSNASRSLGFHSASRLIITAFDLTDVQTLAHTRQWLEDALRENEPGACFLFLVGTKKDLLSGAVMEQVEAEAVRLANEMQAEYWSVSAKTGENVKAFFSRVAALTFERAVLQDLEQRSNAWLQVGDGDLIRTCR